MARQAYKVRRGMVFWYEQPKLPNSDIIKTSVQQGRRPYVVVSCDEGNLTAPTCNIAPCTTETKTYIPTHVDCWFNNQKNTVLLEQVITVDQNSVGDFICMLTDETLERIERALAIQYSIRPEVKYADFKLQNVVTKLESIIEEIIKNKVQQYQSVVPQSDIEESALRLGQMIEDLMGTNQVEKQNSESTVAKPVVENFSATKPYTSNKESKPNVEQSQPCKGSRIKWTDEKRRQFLDDCNKLSPEEVRVKWGFTSIGTVFSTKYSCKNILRVND